MDLFSLHPVHALEAFIAEAQPLHLGEVAHAAVELPRPSEIQHGETVHRTVVGNGTVRRRSGGRPAGGGEGVQGSAAAAAAAVGAVAEAYLSRKAVEAVAEAHLSCKENATFSLNPGFS